MNGRDSKLERARVTDSVRRPFTVALVAAALMGGIAATAPAAVVNLSYSANGFGLNPPITPTQGSAAGIADGTMFDWGAGVGVSPRDSTATTISPYMTWTAPETIGSVRVWDDVGGVYDSVSVSVLNTGGNATNLSDWTTVYSSGTGLNKNYVDVSLGGSYTTQGLRVTGTTTSNDVNVGEVAAFAPLPLGGGTLSAHRVTPTGATASSTDFGRGASLGINDVWTAVNSNLTNVAASDPEASVSGFFRYDVAYNNATIDALQIAWGNQGGYGGVPAHWTLQYQQNGAGPFINIGTFNSVTVGGFPRIMNYLDLGGSIDNVTTLRLLVNAADTPSGRMSVMEFEAFSIPVPEPTTAVLLMLPAARLISRRSRWSV